MLKFEWNALRVGHEVVLHHPSDPEFALIAGTVVMLETKHSKRGVNHVGIRIAGTDGSRVVWPSYLTVHHDPPDASQNCWRCDELVEAAARQLGALETAASS